MKSFEVERFAHAPVEALWPLVADFGGEGRFTPYRVTSAAPGPVAVGWTFEARTPVGLVSARDALKVTRWTPPAGGAVEPRLPDQRRGQLRSQASLGSTARP